MPNTSGIRWIHPDPWTSTWSGPRIKAALRAHQSGSFDISAQYADYIGSRDPQVVGDLGTRVRALCSRGQLPFNVSPSDEGDGRRREAAAKRVCDLWWTVIPESTLSAFDRDGIMLGVAVGYIRWNRVRSEWVPQVEWLPPHGLWFNPVEQRFHYIDGDGKDHVVTPGDGRWVLHLPHGPRSWMFGAVLALGELSFTAHQALDDHRRFNTRHGSPALAVKEPFQAQDDVDGEDGNGAAAFYAQLKKLSTEAVIRLPRGADPEKDWDAKFLELTSQSHGAFQSLHEIVRRLQSIVLLGRSHESTTALGGDGESSSRQLRIESLGTDAETLANTLRDQVWKPFCRFNYGAEDIAPWGRWDCRPPADLAARAANLKTLSEALNNFNGRIDEDGILEEFGLKANPNVDPRRDRTPEPAPEQPGPRPEDAEPEPEAA